MYCTHLQYIVPNTNNLVQIGPSSPVHAHAITTCTLYMSLSIQSCPLFFLEREFKSHVLLAELCSTLYMNMYMHIGVIPCQITQWWALHLLRLDFFWYTCLVCLGKYVQCTNYHLYLYQSCSDLNIHLFCYCTHVHL